jgi:hypothetical protein
VANTRRAQRAATLEAGQAAPGTEQRLLERVLGILHRAEHPVAVGVQLIPVAGHQPLEGRCVTSAGGHQMIRLALRVHAVYRDHRSSRRRRLEPASRGPIEGGTRELRGRD